MARILFEHSARSALVDGAHRFAQAVGTTLGPGGRNVGLLHHGRVALTKDGVTVAREVTLADPFPGVAARMVRTASEAVSRSAGDGTTTVAVLTDAFLQEAHRLVVAGYSPVLLARAIRNAAAQVGMTLKAMAQPVKTREEVFRIALVSANGDEEVAHIVADALQEAGPKGIVTIEDGVRASCSLRVVAGASYPTGWVSPSLVTDRAAMTTTFQNPYILLAEVHLHQMQPLFPILEKVYSAGRPLLIVALSVGGPVLKTLAVNLEKKTLQACAVHAPYFADITNEVLRDMAALTGGTVYSAFTGRRLESLTLEDLGQARSVTVGKRTTTFICDGRPAGLLQRIAQVEGLREKEKSDHEKERYSERLSKLAGAVAVIEVGGSTEAAQKERRDRVDDALHAARGAMDHGVLPGGGLALMQASHTAFEPTQDAYATAAQALMRRVCEAPMRRIASNAGARADSVIAQVNGCGNELTYDARTGQLRDPFRDGILDPAKVTLMALVKAAETASLILSTGCVILKGGR